MKPDQKPMRLQVFMARCGIASRRRSEQLISDGRIRINGTVVREMGTKVENDDVVTYNGKPISLEKSYRYLALNKPRGYLCANSDSFGRPLVVSLVANQFHERLYTIGRLDLESSGLIFLTNDGDFAQKISHPSSCIEKEYLVESVKPVPSSIFEEFKKGISFEGVDYRIKHYDIHTSKKATLTLEEGKNREIRNLFSAKRVKIRRIHRIRIGSVKIGTLKPGEFRSLTAREVRWFTNKTK